MAGLFVGRGSLEGSLDLRSRRKVGGPQGKVPSVSLIWFFPSRIDEWYFLELTS